MAVVCEPEISLEGALEAIQRHSFNEALEFAPRTDGHSEESAASIAFTRALDFLHYLTSLKVNQQFADMTGNVPSIVGASVPEDMEVFALHPTTNPHFPA